MQTIHILYIGRNEEIREVVIRLLNKHPQWSGRGVHSDEEAMQAAVEQSFDVILFGCGIEHESEQLLGHFFATAQPDAVLLQHYGGGSGLLTNEITAALYHAGKLPR